MLRGIFLTFWLISSRRIFCLCPVSSPVITGPALIHFTWSLCLNLLLFTLPVGHKCMFPHSLKPLNPGVRHWTRQVAFIRCKHLVTRTCCRFSSDSSSIKGPLWPFRAVAPDYTPESKHLPSAGILLSSEFGPETVQTSAQQPRRETSVHASGVWTFITPSARL